MGHRARDITSHYSAAELLKLRNAVEKIVGYRKESPTEMDVGKMSENNKKAA
jgi:hypothetical protein